MVVTIGKTKIGGVKREYTQLYWCIAVSLFVFVMTYSFSAQLVAPQSYFSDFSLYVTSLTEGENGYSLYFLLLKLLYSVIENESLLCFADAGMVAAANIATLVIVRWYLREQLKDSGVSEYIPDFLSVALLSVSMLISTVNLGDNWYLSIGSGNPWHNPTYLFARPFSLLAFIFMIKVYESPRIKEVILLGVFSFLSCWAKPSFLFVFIPACFVVFLIGLIKNRFKNFKNVFFAALAVVPSGIILLLQNSVLFTGEDAENTIAFGLSPAWPLAAIPKSVLLTLAFPLYITLISVKKLDLPYKLCGMTYVFGVLEGAFMYEIGPRMSHGNFTWGKSYAIFFMFLVASVTLFRNPPEKKLLRIVGYILFAAHLLSGGLYLAKYIVWGGYL